MSAGFDADFNGGFFTGFGFAAAFTFGAAFGFGFAAFGFGFAALGAGFAAFFAAGFFGAVFFAFGFFGAGFTGFDFGVFFDNALTKSSFPHSLFAAIPAFFAIALNSEILFALRSRFPTHTPTRTIFTRKGNKIPKALSMLYYYITTGRETTRKVYEFQGKARGPATLF